MVFYREINTGAAAQNKAGNGDLIVHLVLPTLSEKMLSPFWGIHVRVTNRCYVFVSWCHTIRNKHIIRVSVHCITYCRVVQSWGSAITTKVGLGKCEGQNRNPKVHCSWLSDWMNIPFLWSTQCWILPGTGSPRSIDYTFVNSSTADAHLLHDAVSAL